MKKITPNIWFNKNGEEAVKFYTELFPDSKIIESTHYGKEGFEFHHMPEGTLMTSEFEIMGERILALNAGPEFPLNPSVSFMVMTDDSSLLDKLWNELSNGGNVLMALDKYPWSERYGWCNDRFGVSWQLYLADQPVKIQSVVPTLMFIGKNAGKAEEAINFYTSIFEESNVQGILKYEKEDDDKEGLVKHAQFSIRRYTLMAMDSSHDHKFQFNESVSLIVHCRDQAEVDKYWDALTADGGMESQCGWCKDKYGFSWQIVPEQLKELLSDPDKAKAGRAMKAMLGMKKLVIADLENA